MLYFFFIDAQKSSQITKTGNDSSFVIMILLSTVKILQFKFK